jgi:hypothetical protein
VFLSALCSPRVSPIPNLNFQIFLVVQRKILLATYVTLHDSNGYGGFSHLSKWKFKLHTPLCMTNTPSFAISQIQFEPCVLAVQDSHLERSLPIAIRLLSWLWLEKNNRSKAKRAPTQYVYANTGYRQYRVVSASKVNSLNNKRWCTGT